MEPTITSTIVSKSLEVVVKEALAKTLKLGWKKWYWWPAMILHWKREIRVSCSAFLRIQDEENQRYLLVKNFHRKEFFGPVGGCYKYFDATARPIIDKFFYNADPALPHKDTIRDLRGYIRGKYLLQFFEWFSNSHNDHESARECLIREIEEEIFTECGITQPERFKKNELEFRYMRSFLEKSTVTGKNTPQYRLFQVYDLVKNNAYDRFLRAIKGSQHKRLVWASKNEIEVGRLEDRSIIGHAAVLFFNDKLTRPDMPSHKQ